MSNNEFDARLWWTGSMTNIFRWVRMWWIFRAIKVAILDDEKVKSKIHSRAALLDLVFKSYFGADLEAVVMDLRSSCFFFLVLIIYQTTFQTSHAAETREECLC